MHEMSIAQGVVDIVREEMARHGLETVQNINLAVGKLAAVVPEHLNLCFNMLTENSPLAGTTLNIREIPLGYRCSACRHEFIAEEMTSACPNCEEENPTLIRGREMAIENIEVPD